MCPTVHAMPGKKRTRRRLRVVIVGAGVSASCGIPVTKDILRDSMQRLCRKNPKAAADVHSLLRYLYPDFTEAYRNYPNIEDFLNLVEMAQTFNSQDFIESSTWDPERLTKVKESIVGAVTEHIWDFFGSNTPKRPWLHLDTFLTKHVPLGDVIITFNWDMTIEKVLANARSAVPLAYQYRKETHSSCITLLKPHGSINWFRKKALADAGLRAQSNLDNNIQLVDFSHLLKQRDRIKDTPVIVAPVFNKEFSKHSVFQDTWASVYHAVSSATVLTILGYSLPREDQFSRFVFRRALRNNIRKAEKREQGRLEVIVVNPDESTEGTFARLVGRDKTKFRFHRAYFQDFVDSLPRLISG